MASRGRAGDTGLGDRWGGHSGGRGGDSPELGSFWELGKRCKKNTQKTTPLLAQLEVSSGRSEIPEDIPAPGLGYLMVAPPCEGTVTECHQAEESLLWHYSQVQPRFRT